jgi:SAM-dependent methyltransferase
MGIVVKEKMGYLSSARFYDLFDNKPNIGFYKRFAKKYSVVLDVGAGTGRIAIPLAKSGIEVYCVEPSSAMLREFERKLEEETGLQDMIMMVNASASDFDLDKRFSFAYLSGTFDHFLTEAERLQSLENINRHLVEGGVMVFDVFLGLMKDSPLKPAGEIQVEGKQYRRFVGSEVVGDSILKTTLIYRVLEDGVVIDEIEEKSLVGITDREEIHNCLEKTGFRLDGEYGGYDFRPYKNGDDLLIIRALKV